MSKMFSNLGKDVSQLQEVTIIIMIISKKFQPVIPALQANGQNVHLKCAFIPVHIAARMSFSVKRVHFLARKCLPFSMVLCKKVVTETLVCVVFFPYQFCFSLQASQLLFPSVLLFLSSLFTSLSVAAATTLHFALSDFNSCTNAAAVKNQEARLCIPTYTRGKIGGRGTA